jgi:PIN domain nuclease of toxin-antitoxin system
MTLLLDTHALLWWLFDLPLLSKNAHKLIGDPRNVVFVSSASLWEIAIKARAKKLGGVDEYLRGHRAVHQQAGFQELAVNHAHAVLAGSLAWAHADPFDRMLVAQSTVEGCALLTRDKFIRAYHKGCRW